MKMEYRVLWIDDRPSSVRGDIRNIERFLKTKEVSLNLKQINVTDENSIVDNEVFLDYFNSEELDFLLVDLNMPDINGVEVISYIRYTLGDYFTPIIFYTNDDSDDLPVLIKNANNGVSLKNYLDGIFFCHRDNVGDKVINLMNSKLTRENKIKSVRGMIVENVCDIDIGIIESLRLSFSHIKESGKSRVLSKIKDKLNRKKKMSAKLYDELAGFSYEEVINYIIKNLRVTDQHFRAEILREILKNTDGFEESSNILLDFYTCSSIKTSLNGMRNKYAHQTQIELGSIHSEENNLVIKSEIRRHKDNISNIISARVAHE